MANMFNLTSDEQIMLLNIGAVVVLLQIVSEITGLNADYISQTSTETIAEYIANLSDEEAIEMINKHRREYAPNMAKAIAKLKNQQD